MTFLQMQQQLAYRLGAYDQSVSSDATKLKSFLNMAQQDITARQNWDFMLAHEIVQTVVDITTGTVSVSAGGTTVTFSSAPAVSVTDWFIKFSSSDNWYRISDHTAASTTATLTQAYGETSNLSSGTYTLRKLFYSTSTPLDSILDIKKTTDGSVLASSSARDTDVFLPLYWDSGEVYKYISSIPESDGDLRFSLIYSPSSVINLQVRGIKRLSDMSADSDVSVIPSRWHPTVVELGAYYGFSSLNDDSRAKMAYEKSELGVQSMASVYSPDLGRSRVMKSLTDGVAEGPAYTLPPQYGSQS